MAEESYLAKRLVGIERIDNDKYYTGKYTDPTQTLVEGYLSTSCCSFVRVSSHIKGASKRFKLGNATKSSIYFSQMNSTVPISYNGYPFEVIATEKWICNETSAVSKKNVEKDSEDKKRKYENSSCEAFIQIRTIRIYTEYGISQVDKISESEVKKKRDDTKSRLLTAINSGINLKYTDVHYCRFPLASAHNHSQQNSRSTITQLDKRVTRKIRELAKSGILDVHSIQSIVSDFVLNTLFAHAEREEKPKPNNPKYFPSIKAIRNHIFLAVGRVSNIPGYKQHSRQKQTDDVVPPSVTKVLKIPLETCDHLDSNTKKQSFNVGFVAVHAGAGFHSDDRWPGYKHLCVKVCEEINKQLKSGMSAGEAVTLAVKMLEDSDMTNAGLGSNLTEDGKIECDASVMDTYPSSDSANQCSSYFGSVACVGSIKNPICAAYKIMDEQRRRPRLELGRIPPSFLVSDGAENWSRAHGIEMCQQDELISESAYKTWQKYHRKLIEKLTSNRQTQEINDDDDVDGEKEENMRKRLDTVGAVVLDMEGFVASAVSSGGLILKMPGRVGQAALYGCGCWAAPGSIDKPAVAISTSGCGEQLVSTMLAKVCAENLQNNDQPYQAIQDTLVKNFLGSSLLNADCDKQAGLLCLHHTKDPSNCTVEVVWGHTTSSMVIGHMSTNDLSPKVVLSRLPDNATPGKSVTVGGSWIKVACSDKTEDNNFPSTDSEMEVLVADKTDHTMPETNNDVVTVEVNTGNNKDKNLVYVDGNTDDSKAEEDIDPDLAIMFSSPLSKGIHESMCRVVLSENFNRKIDSEFEETILSNWEKRVAGNPRFFNAQKFRIHSVQYKSDDNDEPIFTFNLGLTCYRDYMETNWSRDVKSLQDIGTKQWGNSQAYLAEPLGVAAIVITDDDKVIFQWRNQWLAESPGMLDVPGGHPEPSEAAGFTDPKKVVSFNDLSPDNTVHELFCSQMKEVRDELNVPMDKIGVPILTGIIRNNLSAGRPVAYFYMRCHMTSDKILEQYNKGGAETDESTNLQFIPEKDVSRLRQDQPELWKKMCPNSKAAVTLYSMINNTKEDT